MGTVIVKVKKVALGLKGYESNQNSESFGHERIILNNSSRENLHEIVEYDVANLVPKTNGP